MVFELRKVGLAEWRADWELRAALGGKREHSVFQCQRQEPWGPKRCVLGDCAVRPLWSSTHAPFIHLQEEANSIEPTVARFDCYFNHILSCKDVGGKIHFNATFKRAVIFNIVNGVFKRVM